MVQNEKKSILQGRSQCLMNKADKKQKRLTESQKHLPTPHKKYSDSKAKSKSVVIWVYLWFLVSKN